MPGKIHASDELRRAPGPRRRNSGAHAAARTGKAPRRERGVALITALLVVAMSAILVSGLLWRQQVQIRRIENQRLLEQARWIERGALDGTRLILRSEADTAGNITYLGGLWSVPVAQTKLSDFLNRFGGGGQRQASPADAETFLSGAIDDAQSRFNLRNLVSSARPGELDLNLVAIQGFGRLLSLLGMDPQLADKVAVRMRASLANSATRFQNAIATAAVAAPAPGTSGGPALGGDADLAPPLQMTGLDALLSVPGFTPAMLERLRPFVVILPLATKLNINTATPEAIVATVPGIDLASAQALVARRETVFFRNLGDVQLALQGLGLPPAVQQAIDLSTVDVNSSFFIVHAHLRHGRAQLFRRTLIYRDALTHATRIVSVRNES